MAAAAGPSTYEATFFRQIQKECPTREREILDLYHQTGVDQRDTFLRRFHRDCANQLDPRTERHIAHYFRELCFFTEMAKHRNGPHVISHYVEQNGDEDRFLTALKAAQQQTRLRPQDVKSIERTYLDIFQEKSIDQAGPERGDSASVAEERAREWQECKATWTTGGRERIRRMHMEVFRETGREIKEGLRINKRDHKEMLRRTERIERTRRLPDGAPRFKTAFEFYDLTTFSAAKLLADEKPCALNMANKEDIGGGAKKGATAQEENCCYRSDLYESLLEMPYREGKDGRPDRYRDPIEEGGIYSPGVQVFRHGDDEGFAFHEPFRVAVFSAAAFNCNRAHGDGYDRPRDDEEYEEKTKQKIRDMLRTASSKGHQTILLGAFGCGAFKNQPEFIAKLYTELLKDDEFRGRFKKVAFAITDMGTNNREIFERAFRDAGLYVPRHEKSCLRRTAEACTVQ